VPASQQLADQLWWFHCVPDPPGAAVDLVIALGSYDLRVADGAAELILSGSAPPVIFCGSSGHWTRDTFTETEAQVFATRAAQQGLPQHRYLLEERSSNIGANFQFARQRLAEAGIEATTAIVVAKGNMLRRAHSTPQRVCPALDVRLICPSSGWADQPPPGKTLDELIEEMVGDFYRILIYPRLGYQQPEPVPTGVLRTYTDLVDAGYGGRLLAGYAVLG
jgi:uncharacterized SAM-binding protein YcdF (DUF218 family)